MYGIIAYRRSATSLSKMAYGEHSDKNKKYARHSLKRCMFIPTDQGAYGEWEKGGVLTLLQVRRNFRRMGNFFLVFESQIC